MNKKNSSGSGVFLMEMILVVFFFILCAGICILVFVKADHMSRTAMDTNKSVITAQSIAEIWKHEGPEGLIRRMDAVMLTAEENSAGLYWEKDWEPASGPERAAYEAKISWQETDGMSDAVIVIIRNEDSRELFAMEVSKYRGSS